MIGEIHKVKYIYKKITNLLLTFVIQFGMKNTILLPQEDRFQVCSMTYLIQQQLVFGKRRLNKKLHHMLYNHITGCII